MAATIAVYTTADSPRLRYVLDWLLAEQLGLRYELRTYHQDLSGRGISYGRIVPGCIHIPDAGLLWEHKIQAFPIATGIWGDIPTLFAGNRAGGPSLPFDILSAIFYLLTRYEEYQPFLPDDHGRYPATESILHQEGWLERPLVDEWTEALRDLLRQEGHGELPRSCKAVFQPTYDIDIAWSYRHKGPVRWMGGLLRDAAGLRLGSVVHRIRSGFGARDPYDAYDWMSSLHRKHRLQPRYFILAALTTTDFDKNIRPTRPAMKALIRRLHAEGEVGMHPSYYSDRSIKVLRSERVVLEQITGQEIVTSRQHFIRMVFPATCRALLEAGIRADYSMGYSTHFGFRAGTARSFPWYDLRLEQATGLRLFPFCFMDTTARYDLKLPASAAFGRLQEMADILRRVHSPVCTIFHNFSLGTDSGWKGWRERYAAFVQEMDSWQ